MGRAFAEAIADYGADVTCVARDESKLAETMQLISKYGHRTIAIKTDMTKEVEIQNEVPMGRLAAAEELKGFAVLLASDASSYITGQVFIQEGGQSARL